MQKSRSGKNSFAPQKSPVTESGGRVVDLQRWKTKKQIQERRNRRRKQSGQGLRAFTLGLIVLEAAAAAASIIPNPFQDHSVILTWAIAIVAMGSSLWLNVRQDASASKMLLWSAGCALVALAAGMVKMAF
ncbi:hypothetical protein [Alicyclobacillus sp. SO9]|uniref:hypothetical protein n=1 Tax=Alicyclobacillus sp. SO9 TaxID=2665646 RepID=UPI0018E72093|nr:hypothetical protein [Alicyclobacillus sp. SO9]QQE80791.1 hypothetical protein GI364_10640 [Alicyclobacillus sp. SO9]